MGVDALRLGVSACLLGEKVRFDGGHKRHAFLADILGRFATWVPVCPEDEAGFGTPREPMRLVNAASGTMLMTVRTARDVTDQLRQAASRRAAALLESDLDGFIFKKDSPSCGVWRVKTYSPDGAPAGSGRGMFAESIISAMPELPVEEEGRLSDPSLREHFLERAFAHQRLRQLLSSDVRIADLMQFHARHKLQLLAHSPHAYGALGRLVASSERGRWRDTLASYRQGFLAALAIPASPARHVNVLQHIAGYFRRVLRAEARRELARAIADYHRSLIPLVVPVALLAHYAALHGPQYLVEQRYFEPHPRELKLRNDI